jgi:NAD(P) transhydrogenase subunit beta
VSESLSALFYLVAAICFIMALRGLSSPETARTGNVYGVAGMIIAVATTLATPHVVSFWLIVVGILIGGAVGTYIALRIQMTALPQLVAAFHSLVGLAAVCVAAAAFTFPEAYGIGVRARSTAPVSSRWPSAWRSVPSLSPARSSPSANCRGWSAAGR